MSSAKGTNRTDADVVSTSLLVRPDPWQELRAHTSARIALGRVGASMPTDEVLRFGLAHARARDAVHHTMDSKALRLRLMAAGFGCAAGGRAGERANAVADEPAGDGGGPVVVRSQVPDRPTYLLRPDMGRRLDDACRPALMPPAESRVELVIVIADGLSSIAVERHAVPLLEAFRSVHPADWSRVPVLVVEQGRVAIGDDIGETLRASMVIVLIGERPGLSSPDSLGIYFTFEPRVGRMDSERNCISNVRPDGLGYEAAAGKLDHMVRAAMRLKLTGVALKDDSEERLIEGGA